MPEHTLFISDIHLDAQRPATIRAFLRFLHDEARAAEALYILGDLFEAWLGDDEDSELAATVRPALREVSDDGCRLYLMHGNRDFLLGEHFARHTGAVLLAEPITVDLYGRRALLLHGDTLCTGDKAYLAFREQVRRPEWRREFLAMPLPQRRARARELRALSREATSNKAEDIMDVAPDAVRHCLAACNSRLLIHGHTHRPATHTVDIDGAAAQRIVLGDWDHSLWYLYADRHTLDLRSCPISA